MKNKQTFEMSKLETVIQITKILFGVYGLILLTIITILLWK
jgi:hypothetical protein